MSAIVIDDLIYAFPDGRLALEGINLKIEKGERVAVVGPNGAGKTTLMMHLNGLLSPTSGSVLIDGIPVIKANFREVRSKVGLVFQNPDDQLFMPTVAQDVAFGPANLGVADSVLSSRVDAALKQVGLNDFGSRTPHHLSLGQKRRASIATVLAMEPEVLVLDEPTSNLDPKSRRELAAVLQSLDVTLIVVTHDLAFAIKTCKRAIILDRGRIAADGTAELLDDQPLLARHQMV